MSDSKPFTVFGAFASVFTFVRDIFTLFFDSIFSTKTSISQRRGGRNDSSYASRNYSSYNDSAARQRRGKGSNVRSMGQVAKDKDAMCGGGG